MLSCRRLRTALLLLAAGCAAHEQAPPPAPGHPAPSAAVAALPTDFSDSFGASAPEAQGMDSRRLVALTEWVRDNTTPIFSILISRNGKLVYELYTSSLEREQAHYLMSVTKSVTSALVGVEGADGRAGLPDPAVTARLAALLDEVRRGPSRLKPDLQARMVPSTGAKEKRRRFELPR